jgi:arylsulfatase A-like enzyme
VRVAWSSWLGRAAIASLVAAAGLLAWIEGGGADARGRPPEPDGSSQPAVATLATRDAGPASASNGAGATRADAYEVRLRLAEMLGEAQIDVPSLVAARPSFQAHWRRLRGPWLHPAGVAGELVTTIALQTNRQIETPSETQAAVPTQPADADAGATAADDDAGPKKPWVPDVRVWNMNEGSFDEREAIYAPTPATLVFRMTVPHAARLRLSAGLAAAPPSTTIFDATIVDAAGAEHALAEAHIGPGDESRWLDIDADLEAWGGQRVELRLRTWMLSDRGAAAPTPFALALWGNPVIVAKEPTRVPYNIVWVVIDALRPDVSFSWHDAQRDADEQAAPHPPLDALLPAIPGVMPSLDRLAGRGVYFTHAWSAAAWTRPGTLAMLAGERSSELGVDTSNWVQPVDRIAHYYASDPPLLPLLLQKSQVSTDAFVNNFFMAGYANVGLDMGFEHVTDHRYRTRDTSLITYDALAWLDAHAGDRFFLFLNYNSPHGPYDPTREMLARIPPPPAGPRDPMVRAYMAEAAKDDTALGVVLDRLDALGLRSSTLVVVSADHGETLSAAHDGVASMGADKMSMRFHHAVGNFEETTRIPIVMALPGVVDGGRALVPRVRSIDIAPTILEIEGLEPDARMSGRSLLPLVRGETEPEPRAAVSEGRYSRAILWDRWHFIAHDAQPHPRAQVDGGKPLASSDDELYDLADDPGERRNVARAQPDIVAELRSRLAAALANTPAADAPPQAPAPLPTVHVRFAGAGGVHRVTGTLGAGDDRHAATIALEPYGAPRDALRVAGAKVDFALTTTPDGLVGFDVRVDPATAPIAWQLFLDDAPWPDDATFVGPFGLPAVAAKTGIASVQARAEVFAPALAVVDPTRDLGVFVTRDGAERGGESSAEGPAPDGEGAKEMQRVLEEWGYAHARAR